MGDERLSEEWIPLRVARQVSGMSVVTLKRAARRIEKRLGSPVLKRWGSGQWHISAAALRAYLRGDRVDHLRDELTELREILATHGDRLVSVRNAGKRLESRVCRLEGRKPDKPITSDP